MNHQSITAAVDSYFRGIITKGELIDVTCEFAHSGSIDELLADIPADLRKELSDWCSPAPRGREEWMTVQSDCRIIGSDEEEAAYYRRRRELEDQSYRGYCRLHEYFHKIRTA